MEKNIQAQTLPPREALLSLADGLKVLPTLNTIMDKVLQVLTDDEASLQRPLECSEV